MISLVGLPGSGKTTVGRHLARCLKWPFADTDGVIEAQLGCAIGHCFETHGEAFFRDLEVAVVDRLTQTHTGVLSTGGGVVLRPENRQHLRQRSYVIYLNASPDALFERLRHDTRRPLLQVADPLAQLRNLHALRDPLYRQTAHFTLDTGDHAVVAAIVNQITKQLAHAGIWPAA